MQAVIERLAQWAEGKEASPQMVQVYPTNRCNLRCIFCYQTLQQYDLKDRVPPERWFSTAEELCDLGVEEVLISGGGEPLAEKKLTLRLMEIFKQKEIRGRLITNGTLWSIPSIRRTVEMGWDNVTFSIDGATPQTHDYLRDAEGAFDKAIKNIHRFERAKEELSSLVPRLELTLVLTAKNFREVTDYVRMASELGVGNVTVEPVCINNPETERLKLSATQRKYFLEEILPEAEDSARSSGISTNFHSLKNVEVIEKAGELSDVIIERADHPVRESGENAFLSIPCYEPWVWPKIEANGEVWPCSTSPMRENIRERTFTQIWFGDKFNQFRNSIQRGELTESCSNCVVTHLHTHSEMRKGLEGFFKEKHSHFGDSHRKVKGDRHGKVR